MSEDPVNFFRADEEESVGSVPIDPEKRVTYWLVHGKLQEARTLLRQLVGLPGDDSMDVEERRLAQNIAMTAKEASLWAEGGRSTYETQMQQAWALRDAYLEKIRVLEELKVQNG